jgi:hypothetical protein
VRIPSTLLKPAALLLLGASTVFGCSVAHALTFNWNFNNTDGNPVNTGTTSGTITGLVEGNNNVDNNNSLLIATLTSSTSGNLSVPQTWSQANGGLQGGFITVTSGNISDYNFNFNNADSMEYLLEVDSITKAFGEKKNSIRCISKV